MSKQPSKKVASATPAKGNAQRPPKKLKIDFENQRFCPKCGKIIDINLSNCNFCKVYLKKISPIRDTDDAFKKVVLSALTDPDFKERKNAVDFLGDSDNLAALGLITHILLNDTSALVRREAADELGDLKHSYSISALEKAITDKNAIVRQQALTGLKEIKKKKQKMKEAQEKKKAQAEMKKTRPIKKKGSGLDISGSVTVGESIKGKVPWIFGSKLRKPKINFPTMKKRSFSMPMPSKALGLLIIFIILFVLQTGIVYIVYKQPPALGAKSDGSAMFIYPSIHDSFIIEGIVASILIFMCSTGYIFLYQASKFVYNRKMALRILIFGIVLIIVGFASLQYLVAVKQGTMAQ